MTQEMPPTRACGSSPRRLGVSRPLRFARRPARGHGRERVRWTAKQAQRGAPPQPDAPVLPAAGHSRCQEATTTRPRARLEYGFLLS